MKRLLFLACLMFSLNGFSQNYKKVDKHTEIIKRECELIVITTDSITATSLRETNGLMEEITCFSSVSSSIALMFWFSIDSEEIVRQTLDDYLTFIEN